ncbi:MULTISPECIES: hypothetical protein [unclassified Endozoicomonas]|uniref:hypothetical protein n=1 Tax=unclassified Endozoicomonas TaxID=2644528 RepID=UPI003BB65539
MTEGKSLADGLTAEFRVISLVRDRGETAILLVEPFFEFARRILDQGEVALAGTGDAMDEVAVRRLITV